MENENWRFHRKLETENWKSFSTKLVRWYAYWYVGGTYSAKMDCLVMYLFGDGGCNIINEGCSSYW